MLKFLEYILSRRDNIFLDKNLKANLSPVWDDIEKTKINCHK
jgi:hypothetical protein